MSPADRPVTALGLPGRVVTALHRAGITTAAQAAARTPTELRDLREVGDAAAAALETALAPWRAEAELTLEDRIAQAIADPGAVLARARNEQVSRWATRAVLTVLLEDVAATPQPTVKPDRVPESAVEAARLEIGRWTGDYRAQTARDALTAATDLIDLEAPATVKPDRDTIARALCPGLADLGLDPSQVVDATVNIQDATDAVLAVLPGRTEAQVKAEALREAADAEYQHQGGPTMAVERLLARAARIERGEES